MINVTQSYLPPFDEYISILKRAWDKRWLTNNGELVQELEMKLRDYLKSPFLFYTSNGTVVLQLALKALNITGDVITTPFSYVATTNSIIWENCRPVFADIEPNHFCINPDEIEKKITPNTKAILATHVYGYPCQVDRIQEIADAYGLKVIYDGAHAFGSIYNGVPLLSYGDISTCSFHATKIFHTVEGGAIICKNENLARRIMLFRQFGHINDDYYSIGVNAKNSEFHAAMGLSIFPYIETILTERKEVANAYLAILSNEKSLQLPKTNSERFTWNYSYFPLIFRSESILLEVKGVLEVNNIYTRRYFYPSLNLLPYINNYDRCDVSEDIASRVLAIPIYPGLKLEDIRNICNIIVSIISRY